MKNIFTSIKKRQHEGSTLVKTIAIVKDVLLPPKATKEPRFGQRAQLLSGTFLLTPKATKELRFGQRARIRQGRSYYRPKITVAAFQTELL